MRMRYAALFLILLLPLFLFMPMLFLSGLFRWERPVYYMGRWVVRVGLKVLGIRIDVTGQLREDDGEPTIYISNHVSNLDGPLVFSLFARPVRSIVKQELFKVPILSTAMRCIRFVAVDRSGSKRGMESIEKAVVRITEHGDSFLVFPEGTRSRDGRLQRFRRGGFYLAVNSGARIVPVSIDGTFELMPRGSSHIKKGTVSVCFHDPVPVNGLGEEDVLVLSKKIRDIIQSGLEGRKPVDAGKRNA